MNATELRTLKPKLLPLYRVILHNDETNEFEHVSKKLIEITKLSIQNALTITEEAHNKNMALIKTVHQELAELYCESFLSCGITVTIEPED